MFFTKEDGETYLLEIMMRQVPGFRQRRSGIRISQPDLEWESIFGKEGKEEMKLRIQKWVGHADPETTLKIYTKVKGEQAKDEVSAKMSSLIQLQ